MPSQIRVLVIGAGNRGGNYSSFALHYPARMKVIGVADPRAFARKALQEAHKIDDDNVFEDWRPAAERERFADAVIIATPDRLHKAPAVAFAQRGYHILLEKPMAPEGAAQRCLDCPVEQTCPYSAKKIYLKLAEEGHFHWPVSVVCSSTQCDIESLTQALKHGPYGRCVYECDNDVVTNQVVNMEFEGGTTAAFTMVAFTEKLGVRKTTIYGTKGELSCEGSGPVEVFDFLQRKKTIFNPEKCPSVPGTLSGHDGADFYLMESFISAIAERNPALIQTGAKETLNSHLLVFEAERSRRENRVVFLEN